MSTTATDLSSPPSTADPHVFTIKAATLKFDTRESLEPYVTPLIENPVEEVYFSGNTYGIEACAYLGEILAKKTSLKVRSLDLAVLSLPSLFTVLSSSKVDA